MPELSRFLGIVIAMYYNDHAPPHFHAKYGNHEIRVAIQDGTASPAPSQPALNASSSEWLDLHRDELMED